MSNDGAAAFLTLDSLWFAHPGGAQIFSGANVTIPDCRILAICGRSGIGKSTLLSLISGNLHPSRGNIRLMGQEITGPGADRPLVFQNANLFPWLTSAENIAQALCFSGLSRMDALARAKRTLADIAMSDSAELYPNQLSGGMQQRIAIARAVALVPRCLLLDEPFSALDPATGASIRDWLAGVADKGGMSIIIISHNPRDLDGFADAVLTIGSDGRMTIADPKAQSIEQLIAEIAGP